jgi:hypothetical protein
MFTVFFVSTSECNNKKSEIKKKKKKSLKRHLAKMFFAYKFSYFAWIFPLCPVLPKTQNELILRKFRIELRLAYRCPFTRATDLLQITNGESPEEYVHRYTKKRSERLRKSDLGRSPFYNNIFNWDASRKRKTITYVIFSGSNESAICVNDIDICIFNDWNFTYVKSATSLLFDVSPLSFQVIFAFLSYLIHNCGIA